MTEEVPHKDIPAAVRSQQGARLTAVADRFLRGCDSGRQRLWGLVFILAPAAVVGCEGLHCRWHPLRTQEGHRCAGGPNGVCAGGAKRDRSAVASISSMLFRQNTLLIEDKARVFFRSLWDLLAC